MLLDLSRLKVGVQHVERRYEPAAFELSGEEFRLVAPVTLVADVTRDEQKVRLVGRVTTRIECNCGRCLDPFEVPVDADVDLFFLPAAAAAAEGDRETAEADFGVAYFKDETLDLGEVMREQFYLAVPMKPLCREDCKGLCAVCGINKNRETCTCQVEWTDPRLEPLKRLARATEQ
jgi:uncharacterized protein